MNIKPPSIGDWRGRTVRLTSEAGRVAKIINLMEAWRDNEDTDDRLAAWLFLDEDDYLKIYEE